jgi:LmbE family N-acetylglucosaminyl deacetylase
MTLVISTHYDDAVISCAHWLVMNPGAVVATVCSGRAGSGVVAGDWDKVSGFTTADEAMSTRQAEDLAALAALGAEQHPALGFLDLQYRCPTDSLAGLEPAIGALLDEVRPERLLLPLGVKHPDHILTGRASRGALVARNSIEAVVYADLPYRFLFESDCRLVRSGLIAQEGFELVDDFEWVKPSTSQPKLDAVMQYGSQYWRLDQEALARSMRMDSEVYWHLRVSDRAYDQRVTPNN